MNIGFISRGKERIKTMEFDTDTIPYSGVIKDEDLYFLLKDNKIDYLLREDVGQIGDSFYRYVDGKIQIVHEEGNIRHSFGPGIYCFRENRGKIKNKFLVKGILQEQTKVYTCIASNDADKTGEVMLPLTAKISWYDV